MLTLIHGLDTAASRNYFLEVKQESQNPVTLSGETLTLSDLTQAMLGGGLFAAEQAIFIDELLSKRKPSKELDAIVDFLNKQKASVVLWESKELTAKQANQFKNVTPKVFKLPSSLFAFLDNIKPGNGKAALTFFHETLATQPVELVIFMLVRHMRLLLALASDGNEKISEVARMQPWQKGKLDKQVKLFTIEALTKLYQNLFTIDSQAKTGKNAQPLTSEIDFFLAAL
ncbi:MAG: hypothetical protein ACREGI_01495 [Candidatus Levyibacteriota bacterium]